MRLDLLDQMRCPYCGGALRASGADDGGRLEYGLLRCECFEFPVIAGIPLLSLTKGYGGAEEDLVPQVPLQVAAIDHLRRGDVAGLHAWMGRHAPLALALITGELDTYDAFASRYGRELQAAIRRTLAHDARFEVVGDPARQSSWFGLVQRTLGSSTAAAVVRTKASLRNAVDRVRGAEGPTYYRQRFFAPRVAATTLHSRHLDFTGRVLSLCPGHGVFERWMSSRPARPAPLVCVDAQLVNLLAIHRFIDPDADLVCHDLQFDLPFIDGAFDGVFSSTCLPEMPPQLHVAREAVRVTAPDGWTLFDSIWTEHDRSARVSPTRYYRYCQNLVDDRARYVAMFEDAAGPDRRVGYDASAPTRAYAGAPRWDFDTGPDRIMASDDPQFSVLVVPADGPRFVPEPVVDWLRPDTLSVSPAYDVTEQGATIRLRRRAAFAQPSPYFMPPAEGGLPADVVLEAGSLHDPVVLLDAWCAGTVALLPPAFGDGVPLATLQMATAPTGVQAPS
jgi:hypothetical protein